MHKWHSPDSVFCWDNGLCDSVYVSMCWVRGHVNHANTLRTHTAWCIAGCPGLRVQAACSLGTCQILQESSHVCIHTGDRGHIDRRAGLDWTEQQSAFTPRTNSGRTNNRGLQMNSIHLCFFNHSQDTTVQQGSALKAYKIPVKFTWWMGHLSLWGNHRWLVGT